MTRPIIALIFFCPLLTVPAQSPTGSQTITDVELARSILTEGFDSHDYQVRIEAIAAAGMVGRNEGVLTRLADSLHDKNVDVRLATVHALADLHSPQSEAWLRQVLEEDKTPEVSFAAAKLLAGAQDPAGTSALIEVYERKRKTSSNLIKKEERSTFDEFHSLPSATLFVLGKGIGYVPVPGAGEGFTAITMLLKDPKISDRGTALFILCRTKNSQSLSLLRKALQDNDWSVRAVAAQMIAHTAQTDLRDSLPPLFKDKNRKVRFRAAGAYLHLSLIAKQ
jgi:HEAT repeat protein